MTVLGVVVVPALLLCGQVFSPGPLAKPHKSIDGITGCTKCHVEGSQFDNGKCLDCHTEIGRRLEASTGYHRAVKARLCAECHREHRGQGAKLVEWTPSRDAFNHNQVGWPLVGAHKKNECQKCHEVRRVKDDEVKNLMEKKGRESFLGLSQKCATCHHDEHRGQEGSDCTACHTPEQDFKQAPGFNHNDRADAKFPLVGKHKKVSCDKCHEPQTDPKYSTASFPKPRDATFLQLNDIPHASCVECHDDAHNGKFGKNCQRCHTPEGWRIIKETAQDTGFHDKHAFKLRGMHQDVACKTCHGPFPGVAAKFKGLKHKWCADCHADAHVGQLALEDGVVKCEKCHDVSGFSPTTFDLARHDQTRFVLEGSHRSVACNLCHEPDRRIPDKVPRAVEVKLSTQGRRVFVSPARLTFPQFKAKDEVLCETCHDVDDPHGGQFIDPPKQPKGKPPLEKESCNRCHRTTVFADLKFTHDQSRFPLSGKHTTVACATCHPAGTKGAMKGVPTYRPVGPECQACHADVHVGQLAKADHITPCGQCHSTTAFKPQIFDHDQHAAFPLVGRHEEIACKSCHPTAKVEDKEIARYKPVPIACDGCHDDEHRGAFDAFVPVVADPPPDLVLAQQAPSDAGTAGAGDPPLRDAGPDEASEASPPADAGVALPRDAGSPAAGVVALAGGPDGGTAPATPVERCDACHTPGGWWPALFAHDLTGFTLDGKHAATRCGSCHIGGDTARVVPLTCVGCHQDPHVGEFGLACQSCHTTTRFEGPRFAVDAHRRTNFPLTGRHAALPCDECHVANRDRTYSRAPLACVDCHLKDQRRAGVTTVSHQSGAFSADCRGCHIPTTFASARFPAHDKCFPVSRGSHAPVACATCHRGLQGARADGTCEGPPVRCTECHDHRRVVEAKNHAAVPGYEYKSEKCAACHSN